MFGGLKSGLNSVGSGITKGVGSVTDGVGSLGRGVQKGFNTTAGLVGLGSASHSFAKLKNHFESA